MRLYFICLYEYHYYLLLLRLSCDFSQISETCHYIYALYHLVKHALTLVVPQSSVHSLPPSACCVVRVQPGSGSRGSAPVSVVESNMFVSVSEARFEERRNKGRNTAKKKKGSPSRSVRFPEPHSWAGKSAELAAEACSEQTPTSFTCLHDYLWLLS